jgi:hypothetical protein
MEKLTRKQFEEKLYRLNNNTLLDYAKHRENGSLLHLYYNDKGHIGTWQRGGHNVIFKERLPQPSDAEARFFTDGYSPSMMAIKMREWEAKTGKQHPNHTKILLAEAQEIMKSKKENK